MMKLIMTTAVTVSIAGSAFAEGGTNGQMRDLTSNVLASITGTPPAAVAEPTAPSAGDVSLQILVQQAISAGESDEYLEALIGEAADNGQIEVSDGMRTTDGDVDTKTILATIIAKSEGGSIDSLTNALTAEASGAPIDQYHTVVSGDSLAAISLAYYGEVQDYNRIFEANRDQLRSPNLINVGQVLLIPG